MLVCRDTQDSRHVAREGWRFAGVQRVKGRWVRFVHQLLIWYSGCRTAGQGNPSHGRQPKAPGALRSCPAELEQPKPCLQPDSELQLEGHHAAQ